jgi:thiosulfate/3-mercaptopyruvate sulfurtransferase
MNSDGTFAQVDALRETFSARFTDATDLITYCAIGNRATIAWFVLSELLGRRGVRVYDGSWAAWGFDPEAPVRAMPVPSP